MPELISQYYRMLPEDMILSYARPYALVQACMNNGYDPQFLFIMKAGGSSVRDRVKGLIVFNEESKLYAI